MNERAVALLLDGAEMLGVRLGPEDLGRFNLFAAELKKWNRKINLTAIRDDEEIALKHFVDSLSLLRAIGREGELLDLGSGGGFPAIPLKIVCPSLKVVSVDAVEKKILFQRQVGRLLQFHEFTALHVRGEDLAGEYTGRFDWIVSRAFSDIPTFVRMAVPLLGAGGAIVAMKGPGGQEEIDLSRAVLAELGIGVAGIDEFSLPGSGDPRTLIRMTRLQN